MSAYDSVPSTLYESAIFLDSSAVLEMVNNNNEALACAEAIDYKKLPVITTSVVITETHKRLLFDISQNVATSFLDRIYSGRLYSCSVKIIRPALEDETSAIKLVKQYSALKLTFCDALSFTIMLRLGIIRAFSYDRRDFEAVGFIVIPPLDI